MPLPSMKNEHIAAVSGLPAGLIACQLDGEQLHISKIAPSAVWLRVPGRCRVQGRLVFSLRKADGGMHTISIDTYQVGEAHCDDCGALIRLSFCSPEFAGELRRCLDRYARYIENFARGELCAYDPALDAEFFAAPEEQLKNWMAGKWLWLPKDREICISLNEPALYALYLDCTVDRFVEEYARRMHLPEPVRPDRLYIGNGCCRRLFPDGETLDELLRRVSADGLGVTLVTAPDPRLPEALLRSWRGEMVVNDWGLMHRLQAYPQIQPLLGSMLNKRRRDPRIRYKADLDPALLAENALNSEDYRAFLRDLGVKRWEFERCGYDFVPPEGKCSLHLPLYQTNASIYCPLQALCMHGDRGRQGEGDECPQYCRENALLYPKHMKLMGRWNALFALDDRPTDDLAGFDRIILNL